MPLKEGKFGAVWSLDGSNINSQTWHVSNSTTNSQRECLWLEHLVLTCCLTRRIPVLIPILNPSNPSSFRIHRSRPSAQRPSAQRPSAIQKVLWEYFFSTLEKHHCQSLLLRATLSLIDWRKCSVTAHFLLCNGIFNTVFNQLWRWLVFSSR